MSQTDIAALDAEIKALEEKAAKLKILRGLRKEVFALESGISLSSDVAEILQVVCQTVETSFGVTHDLILGMRRDQFICQPRHVIFHLLRDYSLTYGEIGLRLGRDHGAIMHGCRAIKSLMETKPGFKDRVEALADRARAALQKKEASV